MKESVTEKITKALFELMKEQEYNDITITDIVNKAGVSRVTYYRHYNSKDEVITKFFEYTRNEFLQQAKKSGLGNNFDLILLNFFIYFKAHKEINKAIVKAKLDTEMLKFLSNEFMQIIPMHLEKYLAYFVVGALYNVCIHWLENDCEDSIEDVSRIFIEMQKMYMQKLSK